MKELIVVTGNWIAVLMIVAGLYLLVIAGIRIFEIIKLSITKYKLWRDFRFTLSWKIIFLYRRNFLEHKKFYEELPSKVFKNLYEDGLIQGIESRSWAFMVVTLENCNHETEKLFEAMDIYIGTDISRAIHCYLSKKSLNFFCEATGGQLSLYLGKCNLEQFEHFYNQVMRQIYSQPMGRLTPLGYLSEFLHQIICIARERGGVHTRYSYEALGILIQNLYRFPKYDLERFERFESMIDPSLWTCLEPWLKRKIQKKKLPVS